MDTQQTRKITLITLELTIPEISSLMASVSVCKECMQDGSEKDLLEKIFKKLSLAVFSS